jgi:adenosylhomocysteinase
MIFSEVINEAYDPREYPALSLLADYWISLRPFEGVKVLAATPIFRNTLVQYQALLAGGADLYVGYASGKNGAAMPCDKKIVSLIQENCPAQSKIKSKSSATFPLRISSSVTTGIPLS